MGGIRISSTAVCPSLFYSDYSRQFWMAAELRFSKRLKNVRRI
jgi:hypothetical protein